MGFFVFFNIHKEEEMIGIEEMKRVKAGNTVIFRRNWDGSVIGLVPKISILADSLIEVEVILADYGISVITETEDQFLISVPKKVLMADVIDAIDALGDFRDEIGISFNEPMLLIPAGMERDFVLAVQ